MSQSNHSHQLSSQSNSGLQQPIQQQTQNPQSAQLSQILSQYGKQQIIIVSSAGNNSSSNSSVTQGLLNSNNIQGLGQVQSNSGGNGALSLSGLSAQQLTQILQAYGVIGNQGNVQTSSQNLNQAAQAKGEKSQQSHQPGLSGFAGQPTSPNNTNIIVVQATTGGGSLNIPQGNVLQQPQIQLPVPNQMPAGQSSLGQSLQQQIQQLQAQNQIMQQQIIANAAITGGNQHSARNQIINSPLNQYISENDMLLQNLTHQLHQHQKQQIQQQQINNLQRQINQMRGNPQLNSQGDPEVGAVRSHQAKHVDNSRGQRTQVIAGNSLPVNFDSNIPTEDGLMDNFDNINSSNGQLPDDQYRRNKPMFDSNYFRNTKQTQGSSDQQYRNKSNVLYKQGSQNKKGSKAKTPANQESNYEQSSKKVQDSSIYYTSAKKSKEISQPIKQDLELQQSKTKAKSAQKTFSSTYKRSDINQGSSIQQQSNNQRLLYQSATQRQKGHYDHQIQNNFSTQQQVNSPGQTRGNQQQININGSKNDTTDKKVKSKKKKTSKLIGDNTLSGPNNAEENIQQPRQSGQIPIQSDKKHLSSNRGTAANNGQNSGSERVTLIEQPINQSLLKKNRNQLDPMGNNQIQTLQLPPQPPQPQQLTAKEKKKLKLEKEKERERELFEKNFKASDLYICKMGLNIQKTFISRPNAIVVYHQDRLIQLDTTLPTTAVQPSNVPKSVVPPAINPVKPMLITPDALDDFYNHSKISYFSNLGRALEVQEEPKFIFQKDQETINPKDHSIQERKIKEVLDEQLKLKFDSQKIESLAKYPIVFPAYNIKETTIFFNSRFESGNLREVEKLNEFEYNCFVNFDYNSANHSQWFFFSVRNIGKGRQYKFNIMNLQKDESCYQIGMKPFVYSIKKNKEAGTNLWKRGCDNVCYYKNKLRTKVRECAPDYEFDEENIPCYEYEDQASQMVTLNTLSFCYEFEIENDITYFAYFQPYTLTDLEDYLFLINKKYETEHLQNIYKCEKLCNTIGNKPCYVLTITDNVQEDDIQIDNFNEAETDESPSKKESKGDQLYLGIGNGLNSSRVQETNKASSRVNKTKDKSNVADDEDNPDNSILSGLQIMARDKKDFDPNNTSKPTVFLSARVHPGESNASFMIQGAIDFLLQKNNKEAKLLRETFIFKIIPMLNPDGVVNGHYRTNFVGADLNRRWPNPSKLLHPTIYYTKKLLKMCHQDNQVLLFCDFHGHTRKRNVFMYGCVSPQTEVNQHKNNNLIRIVPYLLDQKNKIFSFADCKFANEKEKDSTGRLVMFKEFGILNSYTIESTFYSHYHPRMGQRKKVNVEDELQIKVEELVEIGNDFCETLTAIINSKILKRKFIVDTTTPMGIPQPGQGGNPLTGFLLNQEKEKNAALLHQNNSAAYNQQNNVQSVIKSFINGPQMTPYQFLGNHPINQLQQAQTHSSNKKSKSIYDSNPNEDMKKSEKAQMLSEKKAKESQEEANMPQIQRKFKLMQQQIKIQSNQQSHQNSQVNSDLNLKEQKVINSKQGAPQIIKPEQIQPHLGPQGLAQSFQTEHSNQQYSSFKRQTQPVQMGPKKQKAKSSNQLMQEIDLKNKTDEQNSNVQILMQREQELHESNDNQDDIYQSLKEMNENQQRKSKSNLRSTEVPKLLGDRSNRSNSIANHKYQQQQEAVVSSSQTIQELRGEDKINEQNIYEQPQRRNQYSPGIEEDQDLLMGPTQMNIIDDYINKQTQSANYEGNMETFAPQQSIDEQPTIFNMPQSEAQQSKRQEPILVRKSRTPAHGPRDKTRTSQQIISSQQDKIDQQIDVINQFQYGNLQKNQYSEFSQYVSIQMNENKSEKNLPIFQPNISYNGPMDISQNQMKINQRITLQNHNRRSEQGSMPVMREQKSKSSLSMIHPTQNQSNQMIKNMNTPIKSLNQNPIGTYGQSQTQKVKQNLYKQGLLNSAPIRNMHVNARNSMSDPTDLTNQPLQQVQNFCLPGSGAQTQQEQSQSNLSSIHKQKNLLDVQQRMLAQRKQQAEMQAQQMSNNIMNARQSYQTSNIENTSAMTNAAQNFKMKYGGSSQVVMSEQSSKPYSRVVDKGRPQNLYANQPTPYSANSVLPSIVQENPGGSRIVQGVVEHQRPGSQSMKKDGFGQSSYPHRNIVVPQAPQALGNTMTQRLVNVSEQRVMTQGHSSNGPLTGTQDPNAFNDKRISEQNQ